MVFTGQGIFTGALTTAGAFLAMYFTNFKGIQEMGLICGGGLLLCLAPMMTLLPVLLLRGRQNVMDHGTREDEHRARIENLWLQRPALVVGVTAALGAWRSPRFTQREVRLQPDGTAKPQPAVGRVHGKTDARGQIRPVWRHCRDESGRGDFAGTTNHQAADGGRSGPAGGNARRFYQANQIQKLGLIRGIKKEVAPLKFAAPDTRPVDIPDFKPYAVVSLLLLRHGAGRNRVSADPELTKQFAALQQAIDNLRKTMLAGDDAAQPDTRTSWRNFNRRCSTTCAPPFESLQNQNDSSRRCAWRICPRPCAISSLARPANFCCRCFRRPTCGSARTRRPLSPICGRWIPNATGTPVQL